MQEKNPQPHYPEGCAPRRAVCARPMTPSKGDVVSSRWGLPALPEWMSVGVVAGLSGLSGVGTEGRPRPRLRGTRGRSAEPAGRPAPPRSPMATTMETAQVSGRCPRPLARSGRQCLETSCPVPAVVSRSPGMRSHSAQSRNIGQGLQASGPASAMLCGRERRRFCNFLDS